MRSKARLLLALLAVAAVALIPTPASAAPTITTVASGFDSPRGLAFFHGRLLVAEAGHGGPLCNAPAPPNNCIGLSSQISSVNLSNGSRKLLVSGLFSSALNLGEGPEAIGIDGISVQEGRVLAILGEYPQAFEGLPCGSVPTEQCHAILAGAKAGAGQLISIGSNGKWHSVASVGAFDFNWTAGVPNQEHDANPYGVLAAGDEGAFVADSGSNTLNLVGEGGKISILHHFEKDPAVIFPSDAVPTCVARSGDALWVADLSGRIFKMSENGTVATQVASPLLHHVTGCAAGGDGSIYLVNMWNTPPPSFPAPFTGSIVKFNTHDGTSTLVADHLNFPNMIAVREGALYVSANSICPAGGIPGLCPKGGVVLKVSVPHNDE
jgi:hypothetical protein